MTKQSFIQGTMILLAAGILNRMLGFVPRIWLPRVIGAEGIGLYQLGWPFLIVILTITTGGIPLAVAKLVAEAVSENDDRRIRKILRTSLGFTMSVSILFSLLCFWTARWTIGHLFTDDRIYWTFITMIPIILFVGVSSVYRGYFQGLQNMIPTASSQLAETCVRIVAMLVLAYQLLPYGLEYAAAGAMGGGVLGEIGGMLVLLLHYKKRKQKLQTVRDEQKHHEIGSNVPLQQQSSEILRKNLRKESMLMKLLRISIPVTASRMVGSGSYFLESVMIAQSLAAAGIAVATATAQYGALQGMIIPLLLLPSALTYSLATSLVPSLSEAAARNDEALIHKRLHQSLRLALVSGAPFVVIMMVLAEPLCFFLYHDTEIASMLKIMAPAAIFIYLQAPLQATLQALDKPGSALLNSFFGACIKLILIYLLASQPQYGIYGAIIAISVNIVLVTILHWGSVVRLLKFKMKAGDFVKVGLSMLFMAGLCHLMMDPRWPLPVLTKFLLASTVGILFYLLNIAMLGLINKHDLIRIPWLGKRMDRWLN